MRDEVRERRWERAWGRGGASGMHGEGPTEVRLKAGGQGTRGAHHKHAFHVHHAERVEAQRLVERRRALPSRKEGMRGARCGTEGGRRGGGSGKSSVHG